MQLTQRRLLPHERAFLSLGGAVTVALLLVAGPASVTTLEVGGGTLLLAAVVLALRSSTNPTIERVRLSAGCLAILWFYDAVYRIVRAFDSGTHDHALIAVDRALLGETPARWLEGLATPWLTDLMCLAYLSYHVYLTAAFADAIWRRPLDEARRFLAFVGTSFAVGFLGYLTFPCIGPADAFPGIFDGSLPGGVVWLYTSTIVAEGSSLYDVFPSMHVAVTCVLLDHDWRWSRRRFWILLAPSACMLVSTLYLRYHYAVDLVAGVALYAAMRVWFLRWLRRTGSLAT
ncbi:MAG: phosphatase PAP2 family protein [Planctomycetota bacterium]|nr:phosphatase PAP2 family protein [Planctomycetota bacterium]